MEPIGRNRRSAPTRKAAWHSIASGAVPNVIDMKRGQIPRLSHFDLSNLHLESASAPFHFGCLGIAESAPLVDPSGHLRIDEIRSRIEARLTLVPELRRRVLFPGPMRGRPLWVDDAEFDIRHHVRASAIAAPGGELDLLEAAARLYSPLLDRNRPLWELWFLTGMDRGRIGVLLKLHHSMADGTAALAIMSHLFDIDAQAADPLPKPFAPAPIPASTALIADSLSTRLQAAGGAVRTLRTLRHPARLGRAAAKGFSDVSLMLRRRSSAPRTSINTVVNPGRRIRFVRLRLDDLKEAAHANGGKVNDVVLDLVAGGLRDLLTARGEIVEGLELYCSVAVSLRAGADAGNLGNRVGVLAVPLPIWEADAGRRLRSIARATRRAKAEQLPEVQAAVGQLAPGPIARWFISRQRMINVFSTNLVGPPQPLYFLGARLLDIVPITQVAGNVGLAFCAFSYDGRINLVVTADAVAFPDLDVLAAGMERSSDELLGIDAEAKPKTAGSATA